MNAIRCLLFLVLGVLLSTAAVADEAADIWTPPEITIDPFGAWKDRQIRVDDPGQPVAQYILLQSSTRVTGSVEELNEPYSSIVVADKRCDPALCVVGVVVGYEIPGYMGDTDLELEMEAPEGTVASVAFYNRTEATFDEVGTVLVSRTSPTQVLRQLPTADPDYRGDSSVVEVLLTWAWPPEPAGLSTGTIRGNDAVIVKNATLGPPS